MTETTHDETAEVLLEVDHVTLRFGGVVALNDVDFQIRKGEILGLIGPNGAGKSTTFALISGALPLTAGVARSALRLDRDEEARTRAVAAAQIARVGLGEHTFDDAGSLPLGKQRIVEIARALAADPSLLLLDEPAAGLRYLEKQALADLLRSLQREGMTILLVEHDMEFVMGLTDRLIVMDFGEKLAEGPPEAIQRDPLVLEAYLGGVA